MPCLPSDDVIMTLDFDIPNTFKLQRPHSHGHPVTCTRPGWIAEISKRFWCLFRADPGYFNSFMILFFCTSLFNHFVLLSFCSSNILFFYIFPCFCSTMNVFFDESHLQTVLRMHRMHFLQCMSIEQRIVTAFQSLAMLMRCVCAVPSHGTSHWIISLPCITYTKWDGLQSHLSAEPLFGLWIQPSNN